MKRRDFLLGSAGLASGLAPILGRGQEPCPPPTLSVLGGSSTESPCVAPKAGPAPSWFMNMPEKTWVAVAGGLGFGKEFQNGNRIAEEAPRPAPTFGGYGWQGVVTDWVGGVVDQARGELLLAANGGHNGYGGNEVYAIKFREEVPRVVRLTDRTPDEYGRYDSGLGNVRVDYDDGLPRSSHTFNVPVYDQQRSMLIWPLTMDYQGGISGISSGMWTFDRQRVDDYVTQGGSLPVPHSVVAANAGNAPGYWQYRGLALPQGWGGGSTYAEASPCFWDPVSRRAVGVWKWLNAPGKPPDGGIWLMDPAVSSTWTTANGGLAHTEGILNGSPGNAVFQAPRFVVHNSTPPVCIQLADSYPQMAWVLDLTNIGAGYVPKAIGGVSAPADWTGYGGSYHAPSQSGLLGEPKRIGGDIYKLKLNDPSDPLRSSLTLSLIKPSSSNTTTPTADSKERGAYGKFNLIEDMGNGQAAIITCNHHSGPSFVYKLPMGELT